MSPRLRLLLFRVATVLLAAVAVPALGGEAAATADAPLRSYLAEHCDRCHNEKKHKGEFRMDTLSREWATGKDANRWADVLERISAGEMPPPEEEKQPTAEESTRVVEWIAARLKEGEAARLARRERVTFHKLTREEYVHTIRDLLGVNYDAADPTGLSEDERWNGFERIGSVLSISPSHMEKYFAAAETVLAEALPAKPVTAFKRRKDAVELRGPDRKTLAELGYDPEKVRVDLWPGHDIQGGRPGPGQALPISGDYRVRIQVSGLQPKNGRAPHLAFYEPDLDRMLWEGDIVAAEEKPTIIEFTAHLPAGNRNFRLSNEVPGPSNLPRSGRADPRIPFYSVKDGRRPWQMKLTDETGEPLYPFLIVDWVEWEGPLGAGEPTFAQREFLPRESGNLQQAREGLERFAARAFRRPVRAEEIDALLGLVERERAKGESFESAFKAAMLAVLCSKNFLYLVEGSAVAGVADPGGAAAAIHATGQPASARPATTLTDFELASRLSYFLWSTMPDAELSAAAQRGTLREPATLRAQLQRMLRDPKAARFSKAFARDWLQLQQVGMFPPDKKLYPDYDTWLEKSMVAETTAFFREVLEKNLSLREFIHSDWTMLNPRLAAHYGLPAPAGDRFQRVALRTDDRRGGILTHASVLSLTSDGTRHRPVHRGKWLLESIIGKPPPPPPANVPAIEPTPATGKKITLRMKLAAHNTDPNCAACHARIDPLGLAFDHYDAIGRFRTEEIVSDGQGDHPKVDASGQLPDGRKFTDAAGLKQLLLADLDKFNAAFVEKLATFALRRVMTFDDRAALHAIAAQSKAHDYRLADLVEALVLSELFQKR